jgi:hypothetical protein
VRKPCTTEAPKSRTSASKPPAPLIPGPAAPTPSPEPVRTAPTSELEDAGGARSVAYIPAGLTVVLLRPFPWEAATEPSASLKLAGLESLLWYPILIFALIGLVAARRHHRQLAFPLLVLGATALMYALTEGNLGTAYRHRGEFVWVVALVASLGLSRVTAWFARRGAQPTGKLVDP